MESGNLFEGLFGKGFNSLFNEFPLGEAVSEEKFEVTKGNYRTVITVKFDEYGAAVQTSTHSQNIRPTDNAEEKKKLQKEIEACVAKEEYSKAAELQKKLKSLK